MPGIIGGIVAIVGAPLFGLFAPQVAAFAPVGDEISAAMDSIDAAFRNQGVLLLGHQPRKLDGLQREEIVRQLGGFYSTTPELTAMARGILSVLADLAEMSDEEISERGAEHFALVDQPATMPAPASAILAELEAEKPGAFRRLLAGGAWPRIAVGECLSPSVPHGSLFFIDSAAPIVPGDFVTFTANMLPVVETKVFLGAMAGQLFFYCNRPQAVWVFDAGDVLHCAKVVAVKRPGMAICDADYLRISRSRMPPIVATTMDTLTSSNLDLPKRHNINRAYDVALMSIIEALRSSAVGRPV